MAGRDPSRFDKETRVSEAPDGREEDERCLSRRLLTCSALVETEINRRLRDRFDFSLARFDLLAQLARKKTGMASSEISKRMMVSQGNITTLVERLIQSGHVRRVTSPIDRRIQIISLTPFGRSAFKKMASRHAEWIAELLGGIPPRSYAILMKELARLEQSVLVAINGDTARPG